MTDDCNPDLSFRPSCYWGPDSSVRMLLASIKGADRKRWAKRAIESGRVAELREWMLQENLPDSLLAALGAIHPRYMGGEYLPDLRKNEVEIARAIMKSTTRDVISIRARPSGNRIKYRIVDEYTDPHEGAWKVKPASSSQPLSMGELIGLMDHAIWPGSDEAEWNTGVVWGCLTDQLDCDDDTSDAIGFVTVTSEFYPALQRYYGTEIARFLAGFGR